MVSKQEQERLAELDQRRVFEVFCRASANLHQLEKPSAANGLIDLYSLRTKKAPETLGETDEIQTQSDVTDLFEERMRKRKPKPNGAV